MKVLFDTDVRIDAQKQLKKPYVCCLNTIAHLCKEGRIQPFVTEESEVEEWRGKCFPRSQMNLLEGLTFELAHSPIRRSKWGLDVDQLQGPTNEAAKKDKRERNKHLIQYCQNWLLTPSAERMEQFILNMRKNPEVHLSEFEEKCLRNAQLFKSICKYLDTVHYPDALHLWTAEENGLDVFLTNDGKFKRAMASIRIPLLCRIMSPSDLVALFV